MHNRFGNLKPVAVPEVMAGRILGQSWAIRAGLPSVQTFHPGSEWAF